MKKYRQKFSSATFAKNVWYNHILLACSSVDYQFYCDKSWQTFNSLETCLYLLFFFQQNKSISIDMSKLILFAVLQFTNIWITLK